MNSAYTVDLFGQDLAAPIPATRFWNETGGGLLKKGSAVLRGVKLAAFALSLAASPITAIVDPWLLEKRRRDSTVTVAMYHRAVGRPVSRFEALRIAREILDQAEEERLAIAGLEAARGIDWGE